MLKIKNEKHGSKQYKKQSRIQGDIKEEIETITNLLYQNSNAIKTILGSHQSSEFNTMARNMIQNIMMN